MNQFAEMSNSTKRQTSKQIMHIYDYYKLTHLATGLLLLKKLFQI